MWPMFILGAYCVVSFTVVCGQIVLINELFERIE